MTDPRKEKDYVLGTHDEEIERLGLQHRVWRPWALETWQRAGFTIGQTLLDVGCGPGYAALDLAEIVGPSGRVIAVDRSRRFLDALERTAEAAGLDNITAFEADLDHDRFPDVPADGAWSRWVFAFVRQPRELLHKVAGALRPGAPFVIHEYFDYRTFRFAPPRPEMEEFVEMVMKSWRANGGEPDIGLSLPGWLAGAGFELKSLKPIVHIVPPSSYIWQWPRTFIGNNLNRLVELGYLSQQKADAIAAKMAELEASPDTLMISPALIEIIAVKR